MILQFRSSSRSSLQFGLTLVEMMIALAVGIIVAGTAVAFLMSSFRANAEYVQSTRLTQELRNTMDLVVRDLQRAGYDDDALVYVGNPSVSPFSPMCITTSAAPTVCLASGAGAGSCVIYAYDRTFPNGATTASGTPGVRDLNNGEVRGLRLSTASIGGRSVGVIEYAVSSGTSKPACDGATATYTSFPPVCNATSLWCPLSDGSKLDITAFAIANNGTNLSSTSNSLGLRRLDVGLTGRIAGTTDFTRNVRSSIKVRADCLRTTAGFAACSASP